MKNNKSISSLQNLENQKIDANKVQGGQKQATSEFVTKIDQNPVDRSGGEKSARSKRGIFKNLKK